MVKKTTALLDSAQARTSALLNYTEDDTAAAAQLGILLAGGLQDRISRAVVTYNMAARMAVEAGYLLLSVKADLAVGEFESGIQSLGLAPRRAQELMQMAKFATSLPESRRAEMLRLDKSKVLLLASADSEVIEDLLDSPDEDFAGLSVRDLRLRIRKLEVDAANLALDKDTISAERDAIKKQLERRALDADGAEVPLVMADARAEIAALVKKAQLAIDGLDFVSEELGDMPLEDEVVRWLQPTQRLALAGLVSLRELVDSAIKNCAIAVGDDPQRLAEPIDPLSMLAPSEVTEIAQQWAQLMQTHNHEKALREHERGAERPKGKGRPKAAPEAPAKARKA
jgi:hypothetical protein